MVNRSEQQYNRHFFTLTLHSSNISQLTSQLFSKDHLQTQQTFYLLQWLDL
jgi:hypothetical protein